MNVLIIDDNIEFSKRLENDVINYFDSVYDELKVHIINGNFRTSLDFSSIDLVFLDIDLNEKYTGLNLATLIKKFYPNAILVFVSNHESFVFPALSIGFFQFIRKNKYNEDIVKVFEQIKKYMNNHTKILIVEIEGRKQTINCNDIMYVLIIGHDLVVKTIEKDYVLHQSLTKFIKQLGYKELIQINKNMAVNINYAKIVVRTKVTMTNGEEYTVGRRYQDNLLKQYEEALLRW